MSENPRQSYSRPRLVYFVHPVLILPTLIPSNILQKSSRHQTTYSLQTIIPFGTNRHLSKAWKNMRLKAELNVNVALLLQLQVFTPFTRARLSKTLSILFHQLLCKFIDPHNNPTVMQHIKRKT